MIPDVDALIRLNLIAEDDAPDVACINENLERDVHH